MNIERFGLPVIIAAGLHGALFLVTNPRTVGTAAGDPPVPPLRPIPVVEPIVEWVPPGDDDPTPSSRAADPLPGIPEAPPNDSAKPLFTVPVDPPSATDIRIVKIPSTPGLPGIGDGPLGPARPAVFRPQELDRPPRVMNQPAPRYPEELRRSNVSGSVTINFVVGTDGRVLQAEVVDSSRREFADPALEAVRRWRFEPGTVSGRKVRFRMEVPIHFQATD